MAELLIVLLILAGVIAVIGMLVALFAKGTTWIFILFVIPPLTGVAAVIFFVIGLGAIGHFFAEVIPEWYGDKETPPRVGEEEEEVASCAAVEAPCPLCGASIPSSAVRCGRCNHLLLNEGRAGARALPALSAVVALALAAFVIGGCGGSAEPVQAGDTAEPAQAGETASVGEVPVDSEPPVDVDAQAKSVIQEALDLFNGSNSRQLLLAGLARSELLGGTSRCVVGFSADFPEYVLITVVASYGYWAQLSVHPVDGVDITSYNYGDDYQLAGFDESFWAAGYECVADTSGTGQVLLAD